jgi:hypothetical protein
MDLGPIKERVAKATPEVMLTRYAHGGARAFVDNRNIRKLVADFYDEENCEFYWRARTDVPALVLEVERLRAALAVEVAACDEAEQRAAALCETIR